MNQAAIETLKRGGCPGCCKPMQGRTTCAICGETLCARCWEGLGLKIAGHDVCHVCCTQIDESEIRKILEHAR